MVGEQDVLQAQLETALRLSSAAEIEIGTARQRATASFLYRPRLMIDGDQWCALLGENLQDGIAGSGDSPAEACAAFDTAWHEKLPKKGA